MHKQYWIAVGTLIVALVVGLLVFLPSDATQAGQVANPLMILKEREMSDNGATRQ